MKHTLFWTISAMSLVVAVSVQAKAPGKPGEGFGPHFDLDGEGYGVVSFVAPKGDENCQKFFIEPTQAAKDENVKIEIVFNPRLVSNEKWEKNKEESIWTGPLDRKTVFTFDHGGHKGVHGGATAKDTHHNWNVRFAGDQNKKYSNVADFEKDWNVYAKITDHQDIACGGARETNVSRHTGGELTYVNLYKQ